MDRVQTIWSERGLWVTAPLSAWDDPLHLSAGLNRSFLLAIILHLMAVIILFWGVRHWPFATPLSRQVALEVEVIAAPPPASIETPAILQAVAAVAPEFRAPPVMMVPVPDVAPVTVSASVVVPVAETREQFVLPDLAREDTRGLAALPLPGYNISNAAVAHVASALQIATQGDGGGRPVALSEIRPRYPDAARTLGQEGKVTVRLRVTETGEVESAEIGRSSGIAALDQSAVAATRKARFKPAAQGGTPISSEMELQFEFRLEN